jgi:hypothetical protein
LPPFLRLSTQAGDRDRLEQNCPPGATIGTNGGSEDKTPIVFKNRLEEAILQKTVSQTGQALKKASEDSRGILIRPRRELTLDIRVSKKMLDRAIRLMNAFIVTLLRFVPVDAHRIPGTGSA